MRLIGMGDRALGLLCSRALARAAFGRPLAGHQAVRLDVARRQGGGDASASLCFS